MKSLPTAPAPGSPVSASLIRELIDAIRARTIMRGPGYRTRETPNGTALEIDFPKLYSSKAPSCFSIRAPKTHGDTDSGGFDNPYYMFGARVYRCDSALNYSLTNVENSIVALVVDASGASPDASIDKFTSFADLQRESDKPNTAVFPLYEFDSRGFVKNDFRNIPVMVGKEFMS